MVCDGDSITTDLVFKYQQTKSVKTIAGLFGAGDDYVDGDLNTARFKEPSNVATVKGMNGDNIIVVESWWNNRVRLISLDDNKVVTLDQTKSFGTPAVDNTREKFYLLSHWAEDRTIILIHVRKTGHLNQPILLFLYLICLDRYGQDVLWMEMIIICICWILD